MNDRELLEAAAKAAGIELLWHNFSSIPSLWEGLGSDTVWNPLTDDGDALRLAVRLRIHVRHFPDDVEAQFEGWYWQEYDKTDPYAATRRAIVRAAAEIGRGMK